jgi:Bacterial EndoU nuclease
VSAKHFPGRERYTVVMGARGVAMAVDGPSGPDTPEGGLRPRSADAPARTGTAEARDRAACYEALLKADEQQSGRQDHVAIRASRSAWDDWPTASHSDRLAPDSIELPPERAGHILEGDAWGGGHRHGTGRPGKTEFPADWDDERVVSHVVDVARNPDTRPVWQPNHRWRVRGERDGVDVTVVVLPDSRIWTAWPEEGSPGVIRNPREGGKQ